MDLCDANRHPIHALNLWMPRVFTKNVRALFNPGAEHPVWCIQTCRKSVNHLP